MSVTVNFTLAKKKQKANGEIPVWLRFTQNRKSRFMATGISVTEKQWNKKEQRVRKNRRDHDVLNQELERLESEAKRVLFEMRGKNGMLTSEQLKAAMSGGKSRCFYQFSNNIVTELERDAKFWPAKVTKVVVEKMRDFAGSLSLSEITPELIESFHRYLEKERQNGANTIAKNLERLRFILKRAYEDELIQRHPSEMINGNVKRTKSEKTKLTMEQIKAIEELELQPGTSLWHTRNYFLFSFLNAGIRFGDLAKLQWDNIRDGRLQFKMGKTSTYKNIKLLNYSWEILEHYRVNRQHIFPILDDGMEGNAAHRRISSKNVVVNRDLKEIARLVGIQANVSFHVSRHSFADYARSKGMSIYDISKALGHSDIKITQQYLKAFDEHSLDNAMEDIFSGM